MSKSLPAEAPHTQAADLFSPVSVGPLQLPHRVVMAPLTRSRAGQPGNVPTDLNAAYYRQRASAALIISEATQVSQQGQGYAWTPGVHAAEQVAGWKKVVDAVHGAGGRIFLQLWHVGRISHPALQPDGMLPVAPSAVRPSGQAFIADEQGQPRLVPFVTPRALTTKELPYVVEQYVRAARHAQAAGFDGVEVHSANGYLLDQFINSTTNRRKDRYGGSPDNRARLLFEVLEGVTGVWGADRVGVRLSPYGTFNDMGDANPPETFGHIAGRLDGLGLAYLHVVRPLEKNDDGTERPHPEAGAILGLMRQRFQGPLMVAGDYSAEEASRAIAEGRVDLVAFGRKFIANPDLPRRFAERAPLNPGDPATFYGGGEQGYVDYPSLPA